MRDNRDIQEKLRWLADDMEYMEAPGEWLQPVVEAHSIIARLRIELEAENKRLRKIIEETAPHRLKEIDA